MVAVGIWMVNSRKETLVTRRSLEKSFAPGLWENTAGHLMSGETSEEAIIRELRKEIALSARPENITYLGTAKVASSYDNYFGDNYYVRKDVQLSDLRLQPGETCDAKWVSLGELERMARDQELAPSVWKHMEAYREAFYQIFQ